MAGFSPEYLADLLLTHYPIPFDLLLMGTGVA